MLSFRHTTLVIFAVALLGIGCQKQNGKVESKDLPRELDSNPKILPNKVARTPNEEQKYKLQHPEEYVTLEYGGRSIVRRVIDGKVGLYDVEEPGREDEVLGTCWRLDVSNGSHYVLKRLVIERHQTRSLIRLGKASAVYELDTLIYDKIDLMPGKERNLERYEGKRQSKNEYLNILRCDFKR
jgi:hypothetical protein